MVDGGGGLAATDVFKIAKPLVTSVTKDGRVALPSKDYTALTGGQRGCRRWEEEEEEAVPEDCGEGVHGEVGLQLCLLIVF